MELKPLDLVRKIIRGRDISQYSGYFLQGHIERLTDRLRGLTSQNIKHLRVSDFDLFFIKNNIQRYRDRLLKELNGLDVIFEEVEHLKNTIGFGEWVSDYATSIKNTLSYNLRREEISIGAFIIGYDNSTQKYFIHLLPMPMSVFLYICRNRLTDDIIKIIMGFDYQPWEYNGGLGRIRIQGDLIVEIKHKYKGYRNCQAIVKYYENEIYNIVKSLRRDLIFQRLLYRTLQEIEETKNISRQGKTFSEYLSLILTLASKKVIKDLLGSRFSSNSFKVKVSPNYKFLNKRLTFVKLSAYIINDNFDFPHHKDKLEKIIHVRSNEGIEYFYNRIGESLTVDLDNLETIIGSFIKNSLYNKIINEYEWFEMPLLIGSTFLSINVDDIVEYIDYYTANRLKNMITSKLNWNICGKPPKPMHWGKTLIDNVIERIAYQVRYASGLSKIEIDRHTIEINAVDVSRTVTEKASELRYDYEAMIMIKRYLIGKRRFRHERFCNKKVIDALTRFFGTKTGEITVLASGTITFHHPEHGHETFKLDSPSIVKFTLLNSMR